MDKIRISYSFPVVLFGGWSFRCLYFDSISEVIDFYFQHPEATSFEITISDGMFCKTNPEFYCGEDYREHFKKLGFTVDW